MSESTQNEDSQEMDTYVIDDPRNGQERLRHFSFILLGQLISVFGSSLTSFSLGVWAFQEAGTVTAYTSIFFAVAFGTVIATPFAGALVDRWDKKTILLLGTIASAMISATIATFYLLDRLEIWLLVLFAGLNGVAMSFSRPAITASVKLLIDPDDLARANGILATGYGFISLLSPMIAGLLLVQIELIGILAIDLATFILGFLALFLLRLPKRELPKEEPIIASLKFAWEYLKQKNALLWLIGFYFVLNLIAAMIMVLMQPLILTFTDASGLGRILTICGVGYLCGAILMGVWGGPQRKIYAVYGSAFIMAIGLSILPLSRDVLIFSAGGFLLAMALPVSMASNQSIVQRKVSSQYIGRVDGLGKLLINIAMPLGFLTAGPLAEHYFEPFMAQAHAGNAALIDIYGVGKGRGVALMLSVCALLLLMVVFLAWLSPQIRRVELELKDEE